MEQENQKDTTTAEETATETADTAADADATSAEVNPYAGLSHDELLAAVLKLAAEAEDNKSRYLRTQADFDNFRRRSRQEKEEFAAYANTKIIEEMLPVVDTFEMALKTPEDSDVKTLLVGVQMVHRQLMTVLENYGLQPVASVGQAFDPNLHEGIMQVESEEHPAGTVVEELRKGYRLKEKVIRPAMVKVSQ